MKTNIQVTKPIYTHEGALSTNISDIEKLKRLTMACMLWEDTFYVDGKTVTDQIIDVCSRLNAKKIIDLAIEIHEKCLLRHMPLLLIIQACKRGGCNDIKDAIYRVCTRPDQMTELLSLWWKDGRKGLTSQMKRGLAMAFARFDEYQLAKYNKDAPVKLRDVLFLCHAKPKTKEQEAIWKRLINNTLATPETWETKLSSGQDKKESFQELLEKGKMGKLAIIRNLRNMFESGVSEELVTKELLRQNRSILPFQYIAAAKECPRWERLIDNALMNQTCQEKDKIPGLTVVFVDVSGSMTSNISSKSKMSCIDAASGLAMILAERCERMEIFSFSQTITFVPPRKGMALRDAIWTSQSNQGTYLGNALNVFERDRKKETKIDRLIVITDEQTHDQVPKMQDIPNCYILNVCCYQNGINNNGQWHRISGFSENSINYINEFENYSNNR